MPGLEWLLFLIKYIKINLFDRDIKGFIIDILVIYHPGLLHKNYIIFLLKKSLIHFLIAIQND